MLELKKEYVSSLVSTNILDLFCTPKPSGCDRMPILQGVSRALSNRVFDGFINTRRTKLWRLFPRIILEEIGPCIARRYFTPSICSRKQARCRRVDRRLSEKFWLPRWSR